MQIASKSVCFTELFSKIFLVSKGKELAVSFILLEDNLNTLPPQDNPTVSIFVEDSIASIFI